ncbi:MAG: dTDP-glucose 4,6-dehydratase [Desulfotomaculaceae bacterium]
MKLLVTGGAGFIGTNFIRHMITKHPNWKVINVDKLTYAGNLENLAGLKGCSNYRFVKGDIADNSVMEALFRKGIDVVVNFAAESHVDRSIQDAGPFINTNIAGTFVLLQLARQYGIQKHIQVSTDEVYGSLQGKNKFTEDSSLGPNNPYSASKASADLLCRSYYKTYNLPVIITRCSNNYGPYQFPEKLIPLVITNTLENESIPVYGDGLNVRDWIYVADHCRALEAVIQGGQPGEVYNIGANNELSNLELVKQILELLNKPEELIKFVSDRPGHDRRYAIGWTKIKDSLGWRPAYSFRDGLEQTIKWYIEHPGWWRRIRSGEYKDYYRKWYKGVRN